MRVKITKNKNTTHYTIIKDIYKNDKRTTCVYENLGTLDKIKDRAGDTDPLEWLKNYVAELNQKHKEDSLPVIIRKNPNKLIKKNVQNSFNVGYLFLQDIYYKLKLNEICNSITNQHQFKFDLNDILAKLIYSRVIFPASKLKTLELSKQFLEQPNFEYQHIERALPVICENMDFIQSELYKNSNEYMERNNKILYYDCTNYYFEIEQEDGLKQYGKSKENRPNPIAQMGLFMDGNGIPLAFGITPGNTNEQITLQPLEEKIIKDFEFFYKERWIKEDGLEQRLIITYSVKYQEYQKNIRNNQINRAMKIIQSNPDKLKKPKQNDPKRFIKTTNITADGEVADKSVYEINQNVIDEEAKYDGLYAVCTNLEDSVEDIIKLNHRRWEIEESFRIMKTDFKSRPVYHTNDEMIKAHFTICYLALVIYRYLEKKLDEKYTAPEIIETLRNMEVKLENDDNFTPNYIRTDLTDDLHEKFGFRTDFEVMNIKNFKKIFKQTKK